MTVKILGLDPGSKVTGYGLLELNEHNNQYCYLASGTITTDAKSGLGDRLLLLYQQINQLAATYHPDEVAIEQIFVNINPNSTIKLGQARGVAIAAAIAYGARLFEYTPRTIKQAVVGYGNAEKNQAQLMVRALLHIPTHIKLILDQSDALAVAICHAHSRRYNKLTIY